MAASSTNSWLNTSLLSPSSQQQSAQHALYGSDVQLHPGSPHVQQQQQMALGPHESHRPCGAYCTPHTCPLSLDFHQSADSHQLHDFSKPAGGSCSGGGQKGNDHGGQVSARKIHKADREKLRRDRLNEQFAELASVLDPDRPKNDKATILGDGVQVVKELRSEVKRLRAEHTSLLDESRDLAQEKTELREEKAALKTETEQLQAQLQQRLRLMLPWMSMDPSMMGMPPYGYPMPVPQAVSAPAPATSESIQHGVQGSLPQQQAQPQQVAGAPPYIPLPSAAPGAYGLHPAALQAYTMYANRPGDGNTPYIPYPHYPAQVTSHPQVERPYPQYASPMQPYLMQMQAHQGQAPVSGPPAVSSMYQSFAPGMPLMPPRTEGTLPNVQARVGNRHPDSAYAPHGLPVLQPYVELGGPMSSVQTALQLQTPVHPQPQRPSHVDEMEGSSKAETGGIGSPASGPPRETQPTTQNTQASGGGNSTEYSPLITAAADISSPGTSTNHGGGEAAGGKGGGSGEGRVPLEQDSLGTPDPTLRPPAA
ncbi:unnamed protein product [Calypogeia fissa]